MDRASVRVTITAPRSLGRASSHCRTFLDVLARRALPEALQELPVRVHAGRHCCVLVRGAVLLGS